MLLRGRTVSVLESQKHRGWRIEPSDGEFAVEADAIEGHDSQVALHFGLTL
jgi:hypothetical protein